jgi:hypothetical protein
MAARKCNIDVLEKMWDFVKNYSQNQSNYGIRSVCQNQFWKDGLA